MAIEPPTLVWSQLLKAFVDCLHFSVRDIIDGRLRRYGQGLVPKLAVDLPMGLGITVLAVGRHFAARPRRSDRHRAPRHAGMRIVSPVATSLRFIFCLCEEFGACEDLAFADLHDLACNGKRRRPPARDN